jgi:hypothetical protein
MSFDAAVQCAHAAVQWASRQRPGPMPAKVFGAEEWILAFAGSTIGIVASGALR